MAVGCETSLNALQTCAHAPQRPGRIAGFAPRSTSGKKCEHLRPFFFGEFREWKMAATPQKVNRPQQFAREQWRGSKPERALRDYDANSDQICVNKG